MRSPTKSSLRQSMTLLSMNNVFDAHNHVHLSIPGGVPPLDFDKNVPYYTSSDENLDRIRKHAKDVTQSLMGGSPTQGDELDGKENSKIPIQLYGTALMSTQPRDFPVADEICNALEQKKSEMKHLPLDDLATFLDTNEFSSIIRCYGVHPWFLHLADDDFKDIPHAINYNNEEACGSKSVNLGFSKEMAEMYSFKWYPYLRQKLEMNTKACVGEIGLDGARYDPITMKTPSTMERQIQAFEVQMHLAAELKRPVSIHSVKAWGPMSDAFRRIKKSREQIVGKNKKERSEKRRLLESQGIYDDAPLLLPPKIYFHAFGGKAPIVDQLDSLCGDISETFYGFAPVVNFRSPKTADVIRKIGLSQLVLETDLENHGNVRDDILSCIEHIATSLHKNNKEVAAKTTDNAKRLYKG